MSETDTVIAAFTEMAADYEQTVDRELSQFWGVGYRDFIAGFIGPVRLHGHERVLDIGTGMAVIPTMLLNRAGWGGKVVGIDITPSMLAGARKALNPMDDRVQLVCGSGMVLPFQDRSFDVVTCALATHHMDVATLLREIFRVLRPGGQALIADVGLADIWGTRIGKFWIKVIATLYSLRQGRLRMRAELDAMKNMWTPESWRANMIAQGFAEISVQVLPAKRRWYPPGLLLHAVASYIWE